MQEFLPFLSAAAGKKPKLSLPHWPGTLNLAALAASLNPIRKQKSKTESSLPVTSPTRPRASSRAVKQQQQELFGNGTLKKNGGPSNDSVTRLQTSFNPLVSLRELRRRRWRLLDLQYPLLAGFVFFSLAVSPSAPLIKTGAVVGYLVLLAMPVTRQFFLPSLPIWTYLLYFFCSRFIPVDFRPHIWVRVLPALENVMYGANLSNILSAHTHPFLDIVAWIPYGLGHFGAPAVVSGLLFFFSAPGTTPVFAATFGWQSVLGVTIQLLFPCTPPWYENEHGLAPAAYGMPGSPAGLARVDQILGVDMYTTSFTTAPLPFGAFPSLHAADAVLEALFMSYCFPRFRWLFIVYTAWIWWATMYLSHHYAVDLVGGSLMAAAFFYVAKARFLPQRQHGKKTRWEYEYVEVGEKRRTGDEEYALAKGSADAYGYGMSLLRRGTTDSDEWTVGSSSGTSFSSRSSTSGSASPVSSSQDESGRQGLFVLEVTPHGNVWEGGHARESELSEVVVVR